MLNQHTLDIHLDYYLHVQLVSGAFLSGWWSRERSGAKQVKPREAQQQYHKHHS